MAEGGGHKGGWTIPAIGAGAASSAVTTAVLVLSRLADEQPTIALSGAAVLVLSSMLGAVVAAVWASVNGGGWVRREDHERLVTLKDAELRRSDERCQSFEVQVRQLQTSVLRLSATNENVVKLKELELLHRQGRETEEAG